MDNSNPDHSTSIHSTIPNVANVVPNTVPNTVPNSQQLLFQYLQHQRPHHHHPFMAQHAQLFGLQLPGDGSVPGWTPDGSLAQSPLPQSALSFAPFPQSISPNYGDISYPSSIPQQFDDAPVACTPAAGLVAQTPFTPAMPRSCTINTSCPPGFNNFDHGAFSPMSSRYPQTPETPMSAITFDGVPMSRASSYLTTTTMADTFAMVRHDSMASHHGSAAHMAANYKLSQPQDLGHLVMGAGDSLATQMALPEEDVGGDDFFVQRPGSSGSSSNPTGALEYNKAAVEIRPNISPLMPASPSPPTVTAPKQPSTSKRAKQPRLMCQLCTESPDGFRGEHELRRHFESKHTSAPKRWVCRDPRSIGISIITTPSKELHDCKNCFEGKQYKRYDNAIAHLRRVHFAPPRRDARAKAKKLTGVASIAEKRGAKPSAPSLSIEELRHWFKEIIVNVGDEGEDIDEGVYDVGNVFCGGTPVDGAAFDNVTFSLGSDVVDFGAIDVGVTGWPMS